MIIKFVINCFTVTLLRALLLQAVSVPLLGSSSATRDVPADLRLPHPQCAPSSLISALAPSFCSAIPTPFGKSAAVLPSPAPSSVINHGSLGAAAPLPNRPASIIPPPPRRSSLCPTLPSAATISPPIPTYGLALRVTSAARTSRRTLPTLIPPLSNPILRSGPARLRGAAPSLIPAPLLSQLFNSIQFNSRSRPVILHFPVLRHPSRTWRCSDALNYLSAHAALMLLIKSTSPTLAPRFGRNPDGVYIPPPTSLS
ncbi:hypothetical protein B0H11DRAFT_2254587 [Mycena galericulata]|nr:hypothetical protein B0H11DRAFT_2254587 [Mycena galericulata]